MSGLEGLIRFSALCTVQIGRRDRCQGNRRLSSALRVHLALGDERMKTEVKAARRAICHNVAEWRPWANCSLVRVDAVTNVLEYRELRANSTPALDRMLDARTATTQLILIGKMAPQAGFEPATLRLTG